MLCVNVRLGTLALEHRVQFMSTKEIVQDLLQKLPDDISLHEVAQEIEFVAAVRQGLSELDQGERIPIEDIERELPTWIMMSLEARRVAFTSVQSEGLGM